MEKDNKQFRIRQATRADVPRILAFIKELARYEKLEHEVTATEAGLEDSIFNRGKAEVLFACVDGEEIGFALFFNNFSTFLGGENLYLEDLYIREAYRGRGYGKKMFAALAAIACQRGYKRVDWWCLDWNAPSINFYKKLGAQPMDEWTVYRLNEEAIAALAGNADTIERG